MRFDAMDLKLYDTLSREKRVFAPLDPANVRMYVCGPTVYDFAHIGNARPVIVFDVLFRLLRHIYGADHVTYVRNITDVDDKINARAAEEYPDLPLNEAIRKVTEKTDRQFHEDVAALGSLPPTIEPRATEHIAEMRALIDRLVASGNAYVAEDNVLFSVPSMPDYGRLSKRPLDEMIAGARVEVAPYKRDAMDFVLWKPSKPGEPAWPSPAGIKAPGRPGWHIECSAMSWKHLGETFDIHGGGIDLVFPHHENEIAQSRCAFHTPVMANYWMHNGFLQVEGEKMSKSLGNFFTIHDLLATEKFDARSWQGEVLRLAMLATHYAQPIDWTINLVREAQQTWENWKKLVARVDASEGPILPDGQILSALYDDLNTPLALSRLHQVAKEANQNESLRKVLYDSLVFMGLLPDVFSLAKAIAEKAPLDMKIFVPITRVQARLYAPTIEAKALEGLPPSANTTGIVSAVSLLLTGIVDSKFVDEWTKYNPYYISSRDRLFVEGSVGIKKLNQLIEARIKARSEKNFKESDRVRDELLRLGIVLKDTGGQSVWEVALDARVSARPLPSNVDRILSWVARIAAAIIWLPIYVLHLVRKLSP
jgi:cysteinyl-tRNA synthetase